MNCNGGISSLSNANDENRESDDESKMDDLNDHSTANKLSGPSTESNISEKSLGDGNQVPDFGNRNEPNESSGGTDDQNDQIDTHDPVTERTTDTTTDDREKKTSEKKIDNR